MGGGKDQKQANAQLKSQQEYQASQQKAFDTRNTADIGASRGRADELYGDLHSGFRSLAGIGPDGNPIAAPTGGGSGGGGGGGGGFTPPAPNDPRYGQVEDMYKKFMETGGWDPERTRSMDENIQQFKALGRGGISDADMARMRGGGVYDEFSRTGGLSDKDRMNMRSRATSGIPGAYGQMNAAAERGRKIQGGYGPGAAVLQGRMARQQVGSMADAALNAELGITQEVNKGRQWGAQGMTSSEAQLQDQLARNKVSGLTGASDTERAMVESQMGGKQWGTGGLKGLADEDRAARERAAAAAAAGGASAAANDRWEREFALQQRMAGLEGLGSLYGGEGSGEYNLNKNMALNSAGGYGGVISDAATRQKTGNKSAWDTVGQLAGAVAGGMTGMGAIGLGAGAATRGIRAASGGNEAGG